MDASDAKQYIEDALGSDIQPDEAVDETFIRAHTILRVEREHGDAVAADLCRRVRAWMVDSGLPDPDAPGFTVPDFPPELES